MCHAINVSQSDFTGNYLHAAIQVKMRQKQNSTLALMAAIKAISANLAGQLVHFLCSNHQGTNNFDIKWQKEPEFFMSSSGAINSTINFI